MLGSWNVKCEGGGAAVIADLPPNQRFVAQNPHYETEPPFCLAAGEGEGERI